MEIAGLSPSQLQDLLERGFSQGRGYACRIVALDVNHCRVMPINAAPGEGGPRRAISPRLCRIMPT
jgi:hypothetical protein